MKRGTLLFLAAGLLLAAAALVLSRRTGPTAVPPSPPTGARDAGPPPASAAAAYLAQLRGALAGAVDPVASQGVVVYGFFVVSPGEARQALASATAPGGPPSPPALFGALSALAEKTSWELRFPAPLDPAPGVNTVLREAGLEDALGDGRTPAVLSPKAARARLEALEAALARAGGAEAVARRAVLWRLSVVDPEAARALGPLPPLGAPLPAEAEAAVRAHGVAAELQTVRVLRDALEAAARGDETFVLVRTRR